MAYRSPIEGGYAGGASVIHSDSSHPESINVADAELLFRGHYHRAGPDLVLTGQDGRHHVIPGYFASEQHPVLVAPNGARLTPDIVDLLAGSPTPGQYAQAHPTAPADPIGKVEKVVGDVHVVRNGVSVALNVGDLVYKSDVIETGAHSSAGIGFPDGTALDLVADTRMALNEYSFEPNTPSDNGALFTLVQGGFAFVAGEVAHNGTAGGGMKIATPVATMGIRGTAGYALEQAAAVTANVGNVTFTFAVVADPGTDHVGSYVLIDQFGNEVAVNQAGIWTNVSLNGNAPPSITQTTMTTANFAIEAQLVPELVNILNNLPPPDFKQGPNPQTPSSHGSSTPPNELNGPQGSGNNGPQLLTGAPISTPSGPVTPTFTVTSNSNSNNNNNTLPVQPQENTGTDQWVGASPGPFNSGPNWSSGVPTGIEPVVIDAPQGFAGPFTVSVADSEAAASLTLGVDVILDILAGGSFTVASGISNSGTVLLDSSAGDPALIINGTVDLLDGGTIQLQGPAANLILGVADTHATLVNVNNTIIGSGSIGQGDGNLTFVNGSLGVVEAKALLAGDTGVLAINTGNTDLNSGVFEAAAGGTLQIGDSVTNLGSVVATTGGTVMIEAVTITGGTIAATGSGAAVNLFGATVIGSLLETSGGGIIETSSGANTFSNVTIADGSLIETNDGTVINLQGTTTLNGTVTFEGGGPFTLDGTAAEIVGTAGATLVNLGIMSGVGTIGRGDGALTFQNGPVGGTINADVSGQSLTIDTGNTFVNAGLSEATNGGILTIDDPVSNSGTLAANGGILDVLGAISGSGSATISGGGTLELAGADAQTVTFADASTLKLDNPANFTGQIDGLAAGDVIDLSETAVTKAVIAGSTVTITESNGSQLSYQIAAAAGASLSNLSFSPQSDNNGGTDLVLTAAPTVTALTDVTSTGTADLNAGKSITFTLDASEVVNASDAALTLSNGASALYTSGSGTQALTFTYTVAAGDTNTADLKVTGYTGTLADTAGNALVAAGVTEDTGVAINTAAPTVTALTDVTSTGTADLNAGKSITFTLDASEVVNASDAALTLSNGASALYTSGSGTQALTFTYTVAAGDTNTADLKVTGYTGTLADTAGNALVAAGVTEDTGVAINTAAPTVTALTDVTSTGTADLNAGKSITFTLDASEVVNASDAALTLSNGASALYTSGSGTQALTFTYTVAAGDTNTADLKVTGYTGTLADTAGNALVAAGVTEDTGVAINTAAPTVTALTDVTSTGTADLNAGKSITFTLDASEVVNASDAALTLSNGASALYTSGSGTQALTFTYTVAAGDTNTADLKVTGYTGTLADTAGNALVAAGVTEDTGVAINTAAPTVTALTDVTSTGTADLNAGKSITFTLDASEVVNASDAALTLSNGASALYTSGSGTQALTFTYTVAAGDTNTADLKVTGYTGTLADTAGNALVAAGVTEDTGVAINTAAPTVTALTDVTSTGTADLNAGKSITFTLDASEVVNASDAALTLSNGASALYTSGSGTQALTFTYTVAAGDTNTADLKVTGYTGTLADTAGNALVAAGVTEDTGVAINTAAPTVTALTDVTSTGTADLNAGKSITFTLDASEVVNASDAALTLSNGASALYTSGSGTQALTFTYTVAAGDTNTADLKVTGYTGTLADTAGNALVAAGVTEDTGVAINTAAPTVTALTDVTSTGTADLNAGKSITFTLDASEVVNASDAALTLSNGASALYTSGSGTQALTFTYTVAAGDTNTADLKVTGYTGTLADTAGNALVAAGVTEDTGVAINTAAPTVTALTDVTSTGTADLNAGKSITFTLDASEVVNASDAALTLSNGASALYTSGSGTQALTFTYTVAAGDTNTADLKVTGYTGTLADTAGNALVAAGVTEDTGVAINTAAPTVTALTDVTSTGTADLNAGKSITFTLDASEVVNASDAALTLSNGASALYTSGSGTQALTFTYTVAAGDTNTADLKVTGYTGTLADTAGNALVAAGVTEDTGVAINTAAPTVTALTDVTSTGTADLNAGKSITFTLDASEVVNASDAALTLSNGASALYTSGSGTQALTFTYTVAAGDTNTADLKVTSYTGTLADTAGNALVAAGVTEDTGVAINTAAPTVTALTDVTSTGTADLNAGKSITFTLDASEVVNASDAALTLSNGASALYTSGSGTQALTFTYTVAAGDTNTADLKVTGYTGTLADTAGNALVAAGVTEDTGVAINTAAPTVTISSTGGATNQASQTISGTVTENLVPVGTTVDLFDTVNGASTLIGTATVSSSGGTWTTSTPVILAAGTNSIVAEDTDAAGNTGVSTSAVVYTLNTTSDQWINANGGSWYDATNASIDWAFGIPLSGEDVSISTATSANVTVGNDTLVNTLATVSGSTLEITGGTFTISDGTGTNGNAGIVLADGGASLQLTGTITNTGKIWVDSQNLNAATLVINGSVSIQGSGLVQLDAATTGSPQDFIFGSVSGGTLDNFSTIAGAGNIGNNGDGKLTLINDTGGVIDATNPNFPLVIDTGNQVANKGTLEASNGGDLIVRDSLDNEGGSVSIQGGTVELGVTNGLTANFSATGGTLQLDNTVTGGAAAGVDATSTGTAAMTLTGAGNVSSTGADGIGATSAGGNITITPAGSVSGAGNGIFATQDGAGNVTISVESGVTITSSAQFGIEALSEGTGNISVSTTTGDTIDSGGAGILAENQETTIPSDADSSINVTAYGAINSGTSLTPAGNRPAGILAGYYSGGLAEPGVTGTVTVDNFANITALAGDGIRAFNYGAGNVTVTDEANTTIQTTGTQGQYGIEAFSDGTSNISVSTATGDLISAASTGINVANEASTTAGSTITVTAYGTIDSGSTLNTTGTTPAGILAGYFPSGEALADANVNGSVTVNNFANITASAGWGIDAYNYGNGNVTVNDNYGTGAVTSTAVSGAQYGIAAYALSGGTGDVTANVGTNATISTANGLAALFGIQAFSQDVGNVTVSMSAGDVVTSGSAGVVAESTAATDSAGSTITVTADGIINSGTNTQPDGFPAAGILTGYDPNTESPDSNVHGNVIVTSDAMINAASGFGIWAFNFGTGNVTVTTETDSSITASGPNAIVDGVFTPIGIGAYAFDGGNVSVTNAGTVTAANGVALDTQASGGEGAGTVTVTNNGGLFGEGTTNAVVQISTGTGAATLDNTGTIAPVSLSASGLAIFDNGGPITIDNSGTIIGQVIVADAAFNNQPGGVWDIGGSSGFGASSDNTIDNAGVIDAVGNASISDVVFTTESTGTTEAADGATLNVTLNTGSWNYGTSDADGGTIIAHIQLGTGNSGTIEAANGGTNTIDVDGGGNASVIGGNYGTIQALAGGTIDINGESNGFLNSSAAFASAAFGTITAPNGTALGNGIIEALFGGAVNFAGSVTNAINATIQALGLGSSVTVGDSISDESAINNSGAIAALNAGSVSITAETLTNNPGGVISSSGNGSSVSITEGSDTNNGTVEAAGGGSLSVSENTDGSVNNATVEAIDGGTLTIEHNDVIGTNAATGVIEALNGGIVTLDDDRSDVNDGLIAAANGGTVNINLALDEFADGGSGPAGGNFGTFEALAGGTINVVGGSTIEGGGGTAQAIGFNATIDFSNTLSDTAIENLGLILAQQGGTVSFNNVLISDGSSGTGGGEFEANDGTLFVNSNSTLEGATPFNVVINAEGVAEFDSLASTTEGIDHKIDVTFDGAGTFALAVAPLNAAIVTLTDFGEGDTLDLRNLAFSTEETASVSGNTLTIAGEQFTLAGTEPTNGQVVLISDPFGGTEAVFGTADVWTGGTGNWNASNFENWDNGSGPVPTLLNTAEITTSGITVTLDDTETVGNLVLGAPGAGGPTLEIGPGASLLESNALDIYGGQIFVDADASMTIIGPIDNAGSITLRSQGDAANPATLTLAFGANHDAIGTLQDTGDNSIVNAEGTETLDNGTLSIGSTAGSHLINYDPLGAGAALVLGPNLIIDQTGMAQIASTNATTAIDDEVVSFATINTSVNSTFFIQPDFFINQGDINANASGATLDIIPTGSFTNFGTVAVSGGQTAQIENGFFSGTQPEGVTNQAGGVISVSGIGSSLSIDSSTFDNSGVVEATNGGSLQIEDPVNNFGTGVLAANGGTIIVQGAVTGDGTSTIGNSGLLDFQSSVSADQAVDFTGAGTLDLATAPASGLAIAGFGENDTIDLANLAFSAGEQAVWTQTSTNNGGAGTLQIFNGGALEETLNLNGIYAQNEFALSQDTTSAHGTDVNFNLTSFSGATAQGYQFTGTSDDGFQYAPGTGYTGPQISPDGSTLTLTDGNGGEAGSWFGSTPQSISGFTVSFDYQATGSGQLADGMAFILQNDPNGSHALEPETDYPFYGGSGLGYAEISNSLAVEFNLLADGTSFQTDGATGGYNSTGGVAFGAGDPIKVVLSYNGSVLTESVTDLSDGATYTANDTITLAQLEQILGNTNTAYVGFSAADGGLFSTQTISNFNFASAAPVAHWVGADGDDWSNPNDWTDGNGNIVDLPNANNDVVIDESGAYTLTITDAEAANSLTITPAGAGADVQDEAGGSLAITGALIVDAGSFSLIGGSLTTGSIYVGSSGHFIGEGTVQAPIDNDGGFVEALGNLALLGAASGSGTYQIDNGNVLEFGSSVAGGTVTFGGTSGTLKIDAPASFGPAINMAHSDPGEILDLGGLNSLAGDIFTTSTTFNGTLTTLTVTDQTQGGTSEFVNLVGDFTGAAWTVTVDGSGGADVSDPPATHSPGAFLTSVPPAIAGEASFSEGGESAAAKFDLTPVTDVDGTIFDFPLAGDQINLAPGQAVTQSYSNVTTTDPQNPGQAVTGTMSVSIGGPGNDNFIFAPGIGADTIANFNPLADTIELEHFANLQNVQQLAALVTPDAHGDAVIELGHNDSITLPGVTQSYLQAHLQSLLHLA